MIRYYSIRGFSKVSFQHEDGHNLMICIEPGMNAITVLSEDIDSLVDKLKLDGLRVDEVNALDGSDAHFGTSS